MSRRRVRRFAAVLALAVGLLAAEVGVAASRDYLGAADAPALAAPAGPPDGAPLRIALLGDSTAAGVGASGPGGTVGAQLADELAGGSTGPGRRRVELASVAESGARAADLDGQVDRLLTPDRPAPDVAVVLVGANDATHLTPLVDVRSALAAAVRRLRAAGAEVVVGTCPDLGAVRAFAQPLRVIAAWQGRRVADASAAAVREAGGTVVDLARLTGPAFRADPATLAGDDFHPSDRGYALWVRALLPAVRDTAR